MPIKYRTYAGSGTQFMDAMSFVILAVYFRYIDKHWWKFQVFGIALTFASCLALFAIPESPKYLYSKKRYDDARKALAYIAKFNRVKNYSNDFLFDAEVVQKPELPNNVVAKSMIKSHVEDNS